MKKYKLLTPGPLTTTESVKKEMLFDHCTWDEDYKSITQAIRKELLALAHVDDKAYTTVLMQGSGTFGVESVLSSVIKKTDKVLVCTNGEYGKRIAFIGAYLGLNMVFYEEGYDCTIAASSIAAFLKNDSEITHVAMVHCETTTGVLNDIEGTGLLCRKQGITFIVDAMSSFGGIEIDMEQCNIDFLISSANKCIQGVPGFSFIIAKRSKLEACAGIARSLSLDLYDQWIAMEKDGKWRFTSPTHVVLAFAKALEELKNEGGVIKRQERYTKNNKLLIANLKKLGIEPYLREEIQSPIITAFYYPKGDFSFAEMYEYIKERGYAIYPGKLTDVDTFRIGNIGEIYQDDIEQLTKIFQDFLLSM